MPPSIPARELFAGRKEITIEHRGVTYRLRITRNDKLILTK
ncbi:MAG: hemin uptake protein HemP [Pseudomonadota bacterium]